MATTSRNFRDWDASKPLVSARFQTVMGNELRPGDPLPDEVEEGIRRRLWMTRLAHYSEDHRPTPVAEEPEAQVEMAHSGGGYYLIKAPWLSEPERVQGKAKAQARVKELEEAGPPAPIVNDDPPPPPQEGGEQKTEDDEKTSEDEKE